MFRCLRHNTAVMTLWRCSGMAHRLRAGPHPDASRAHPVFTSCQPCTAGRHQPSAAPSGCDRLFNPQTTQPPPAARPSALPIACRPGWPGPQQPQQGPSRLPSGETHQRSPAGLPQAAPGLSQGQRRGAWGEPCSLALGGRHHIARPQKGWAITWGESKSTRCEGEAVGREGCWANPRRWRRDRNGGSGGGVGGCGCW